MTRNNHELNKLMFRGGENLMEVNIGGRPFCHLADYLFNEEQAARAAPWTPLFQYPRQFPYWPY